MRRSALMPVALGLLLMGAYAIGPKADAASTIPLDIGVSPEAALFRLDRMLPGDSRFAALTVSNEGSEAFEYTVSVSTTDPDGKGLARRLEGGVRGVTGICDSTAYAQSTQRIGGNSALAGLSTTAPRTLMPGAREIACFRIHLPIDAGNEFQGASCSATFRIQATPVKEVQLD